MINKRHNYRNSKRVSSGAVCQSKMKGQVIIEFTFCLVIVLLMIYGVTKVFIWAGRDLVERRKAHDEILTSDVSPRQQITPDFYYPVKMNAIWVKK